MKLLLTLIFTFAWGTSQASQEKLNQIQNEKSKIENYIASGQSSPELRSELAKLNKKEKELLKQLDEKQKEKIVVRKKTPVKSAPKKVTQTTALYSFNKSLPLKEQYEVVLTDLEREQETLAGLQDSLRRGVASSYLLKPIKLVQNKISAIQYEKTKLDRKIAQKEKNSFDTQLKIGAMLDFYYLYSPNRAQEGTNIESRNYDRRNNDFTLNLLEINAAATLGKVDIYVDLDFGDFAEQNSAHAGDTSYHNLGQAYLTYNFSDKFNVSAGKMYTHVGYEVAKAMDNWNYSRSFAFSLGGPFWHEGIALKYNFGGGLSSGLFIYDNSDSTSENNSDKTYGAQLGYANEKFSFLFNVVSGPEGADNGLHRTVYEFNTQYAISNSLSVALNGVMGKDDETQTPDSGTKNVDKEWQAIVVYLNWQASEKWSFTPRYEVFSDKTDGAATNAFIFSDMGATEANDIQSMTLTSTYHESDNTQFRIEYRNDKADQDLWTDEDNDGQDNLSTISLSWLTKI